MDRHLAARGEQKALSWISIDVDAEKHVTYRELHAEVNRMAAMRLVLGVKRGDRIIIYAPFIRRIYKRMVPEASFAIGPPSPSATR